MTAPSLDQALQAHQQGDVDRAITLYRDILAEQPDQLDALALLGVAMSSRGKHEEALRLLDRAVMLDPAAALFRLHQGNARMEAGDLTGAVESFEAGRKMEPMRPEFSYNLGNAQRLAGAWEEALKSYETTLRLSPNHFEARNNYASVLAHFEKFPQAVEELKRTLLTEPHYFDGWLNLCNFAEKAGDYALAHEAGMQSIALDPTNEHAWLGLGVALNKLGRDEEALVAYQEALRLKPDWVEVWDNIGQTYQFLNRLDEAEQAYRKTIDLSRQTIPDDYVLDADEKEFGNRHWHLALLELLKGDLKNGFARYRARFNEVGGLRRPEWPVPVWRGEDLSGKTILVMDEQGMGDCLMMARYLPLLRTRGACVKFLVQAALVPLFEGWSGADEVIARGQPVSDFDYYVSIFDLPYAFNTALENIPIAIPYLPVLPPDEDTYLPSASFRVGVVWAGAPLHKHDNRRSVPLTVFASLFGVAGVQFYSFNRDKREGDEEILAHANVIDLAPRLRHFGDTSRLMAQMDLIISCDTSTAHLAGGMGKPVWTLLPYAPDWRWLSEREDSPWYPSMKLFRQKNRGDWIGLIGDVQKSLFEMVSSSKNEKNYV